MPRGDRCGRSPTSVTVTDVLRAAPVTCLHRAVGGRRYPHRHAGVRAAEGPARREDRVLPARGRAVGDRRRRGPGAGRVRGPRLLPVVDQAEPGHRHERGLPAAHPRGRAPVGARARVGQLLPHRRVAVADPRADPPPPLLLQPALAALRPRARRRDGGAGRHRGRSGAARAVRRGGRGGGEGVRGAARRAWSGGSPTSRTRRCGASRPGRPRARSCPTPPRPASWSPATTGRGGTSSRCGPRSTPTSRSARWPSSACASCSARCRTSSATSSSARLDDGTEIASSPFVTEG